jgi:biotin operon repressor
MPRGKQPTDYEKGQIDARLAKRDSYEDIAKALGRSRSGVETYALKHKNYGQKKRSGRHKKLTKRDERAIGGSASNSTKSAAKIKAELNLNASRTTVWRAIKKNPNIVRAKMMKAPKLKDEHKRRRLEFVRQNMARDWSKVDFSKC